MTRSLLYQRSVVYKVAINNIASWLLYSIYVYIITVEAGDVVTFSLVELHQRIIVTKILPPGAVMPAVYR